MAPGLVQADSYGLHRTVGLRQRLKCCNGELKARQERQQGSRQQKSLQMLRFGWQVISLPEIISRAVEVTQYVLQRRLWPRGW